MRVAIDVVVVVQWMGEWMGVGVWVNVCVRERKRESAWVCGCGCGCFSLFLTGTSLPPTTILSTRGSHAHDEGERDKVPYM